MSEELENKEFDKHVRNKFTEHETAVPDHLWASIDREAALLETESLRKRVAWYRWALMGLVLLLGGVVFFYQFKDELAEKDVISEVKKEEQPESPTIIEETAMEKVAVSPSESSENSSIEKPVTQKANEPVKVSEKMMAEEQVEPTKMSDPKENKMEPSQVNQEVVVENKESVEPIEEPIAAAEETAIEEVAVTTQVEPELQEKASEGDDTTDQQLDEKENEGTRDEVVVEEMKDKQTGEQVTDVKDDKVVEHHDEQETEVVQADANEEVIAEIIQEDSSSTDSVPVEIETKPTDVTPDDEKKPLSKFTATLAVLPNFSSPGLEAAGSTHEIYKTKEGAKFRLSFATHFGYRVSDKATLRLGVNYHQSKTELELTDQRPKELPLLLDPANGSITVYSSLGTTVINNIGNFDFAGDDEDDEDLDDEDDFASLNFKEEQEFLLINVPITLGYEIGKGKLKLYVEGGIVTSIMAKAKSKIEIGNVHKPDVLASAENYHQTKKMALGGTAGVGLKYGVSRRFSIIGLPSYQTSFMDMNQDSASKMKPNAINFSFGLQYRF